jgi:hypothetical protein
VSSKIFFFFLITSNLLAQSFLLSGKVINSETLQPVSDCNIFISQLKIGAITNEKGDYNLNIPPGKYIITCSFIGYKTIIDTIIVNDNITINFKLLPHQILLNETIVKSTKANLRETPVAFSEKNRTDILRELGAQDIPHLLQSTPSIYISSLGGGTGDLRMNMRGFDHTHFAVMINNIPINNPENGEIYWSNWSGIGDVTDKIQVQRGLTANPYSMASVGGLINVQTVGVQSLKDFIKLRSEFGSDNFRKFSLAFNTHIIPNKFSVTLFLSKKNWDGYADQTYLHEFTYYIGVGGVFNNNSLQLRVIGSPQKHGQRMTRQNIVTWEKRGKRYNPDWGKLLGTPINLRDNRYHNPTISLNHNWQINNNLIFSNLLYYIYGNGGGTVPPWKKFDRTEEGLIDFDKEYRYNSTNIDSAYSTTLHKTENALRFFNHMHKWFGFLSTLKYSTNNSTYTIGIDYRYYKANNHQEVGNLLGGDYTIGFAGQNNIYSKPLFLGDKIDFDADSYSKHFGGFAQYEYNKKTFSFYFDISLAGTAYNRIDFFNYRNNNPKRETGWISFLGYFFKSGVNLNLDKLNNIYFNAGVLSKPPYSFNVFDYGNRLYKNIKNETILSLELGYGLNSNTLHLHINTFYTEWKDKSFNKTQQDWASGRFYFLNISGANSKHYGMEMETKLNITSELLLTSMLSISENKFTRNAVTAKSPEDNPTQIEYITSYIKDTFLPDFPMTTASFSFLYQKRIKKIRFYLNPIFNFIANQYAQFNPTTRINTEEQKINSWKLPNAYLLNMHLGVNYSLRNFFIKKITFDFHLFNILNRKNYIVDALDGLDHSANTALVWYGRERWWNMSFALNF